MTSDFSHQKNLPTPSATDLTQDERDYLSRCLALTDEERRLMQEAIKTYYARHHPVDGSRSEEVSIARQPDHPGTA